MEKSVEVEDVATRIATALVDLGISPKMYHATEDQINFKLLVDGKKVFIKVKISKNN